MDAAYYIRDFSLLLQDVCNIIETSVREFNDYHVTSKALIGASGVVLLGSESIAQSELLTMDFGDLMSRALAVCQKVQISKSCLPQHIWQTCC